MLRLVLLVCGIGLLVLTCFLCVISLAKIGINDAEWVQMAKTGFPHGPNDFKWSEWRVNDGSITPLLSYFGHHQNETPIHTVDEYRIGIASDWLFDFIFFQGRSTRKGAVRTYPALGPHWGASYHWVWAVIAACLSVISFVVRRCIRTSPPAIRPQDSPSA